MDQNQSPSEPSTVRPVVPEPPISTSKVHYGRRLLIVSIIAYLLPLISFVLPALFLGDFPPSGGGLAGILYIIMFGIFLIFLLNVFVIASEITLLIMSIRYLNQGRLAGKARVVASVSLVVYSLLTMALLVLDVVWMIGDN
jgi:hypothetical protein